MLLTFEVRNYQCFRDNALLTLASSTLQTNIPRKGQQWSDCIEPVAAIYGPNASGKTTLLDAIWSVAEAIRSPGSNSIRRPSHPLADTAESTDYLVEFVAEKIRYEYQIEATDWGIKLESLHSYPKGSRRLLFERKQESRDATPTLTKGTSLTGPTSQVWKITRSSALFLATALKYGHSMLTPPARGLLSEVGINYVTFRSKQDSALVERMILEILNDQEDQEHLVKGLLRAADLGITDAVVREEEISSEFRDRMKRALAILHEGDDTEVEVPELTDVLEFGHRGPKGESFTLQLHRESAGTLTWMTTSWHALNALRTGTVLLIDELDASLHPDLARYLVKLFLTPHINSLGAQLIFTTHDVTLLNNAPTRLLEPAKVWFVEKDDTGGSDLFSLADFDNRQGNNPARRYLAGKFGALPDIDERIVLDFIKGDRKPGASNG